MGRDYATVHRGVYARSADMTLAYEAARRRIAAFIGARENEIAFVRGATEAINLVAYSHPKKGRVLLSTLEHHSNIVPWQLAGDRKSVVSGKSVSVRVALGGRRIITKKKNRTREQKNDIR